ncbi:hypothetical protein F5B21DRAFT_489972 [Xylaria acuta]|nr:hypothetical protein F5B21DRAFT_489972 [Xylaria acuta]
MSRSTRRGKTACGQRGAGSTTFAKINNKITELGELVILDRNKYRIEATSGETITVLGCTLFSRVPPEAAEAVSFGINDFYYTAGWSVEQQHNAAFKRDPAWLNAEVTALKGGGQYHRRAYALQPDSGWAGVRSEALSESYHVWLCDRPARSTVISLIIARASESSRTSVAITLPNHRHSWRIR